MTVPSIIGRRAFLQGSTLVLASSALQSTSLRSDAAQQQPVAQKRTDSLALRIGLLTDLHYADKPAQGTRHYRDTLEKLSEAAAEFQKLKPDFVVELGDLIDSASSGEAELEHLRRIDCQFKLLGQDRHYVLGNHCVSGLTKEEFLGEVQRERSHYSFVRNGFRFVIMDACFRMDGVAYGRENFKWNESLIPPSQIDWLKSELATASEPIIVFVHQRLDVATDVGVKNGAEVRSVLENSEKVLAVFQGHSHKNDYNEINGIHYTTLVAMVEGEAPENNGYSVLDIAPDKSLKLTGFRKQLSRAWNA